MTRKWERVEKDEYYTPVKVWNKVKFLLEPWRDKLVYEGFYGKGHGVRWLKKNNFNVMWCEKGDFFEIEGHIDTCDCVVSNPPFSKKFKAMKLLVEKKKPFMFILPTAVICTKNFRQIFENELEELSYAFPEGRLNFIKGRQLTKSCAFSSCYVFYRMNLDKQVYYV